MASRDFLGGFGGEEGARAERAGSVAGESDEVELSLGLSLGGCFGADPARDAKKPCLERSSSIASCSLPGSDDLAAAAPLMRTSSLPAPLMRTSSLPTETEEERRRRREMQSLKRLEAKRKRLERRNSMNSGRSGGGRDDGQEPLYPSGFQLRRSVASQGSTSSSVTEQGIAVLLVLGCVVSGGAARPLVGGGGVGEKKAALQTSRPFNIAHRGSNGELPEETAAAYMRAIDEGADFIESDISATKDGHLVCVHDMTLDDTTDVADHKEFAGRRRTLEVQWANVTGYFITDFTLAELKSLRAKQRWEFRDKSHNGVSPIITFDEFLNIALNAKRVVGIYPEMKNPVFINKQVKWADGKKYEDKFIATLKKYGYGGKYMSKEWLAKPLFIQSFAPTSLIYAADLIDSPKVFLIDDVVIRTEDTNQSYDEITSDEYLDYMKEYVVGVGPWKDTVVPPTKDNKLATPTDLVAMAHARGLQVHPYTYRNENQFLHFNFRQDPYAEYDYWLNDVGVDGLFTDFPASLRRYQEWTANKRD